MSTLPSDTPRLPKWPFLAADAALLGMAIILALRSETPLSPGIIFGITGCVALAAILGAIPFLADYAAQQDEALDERQRELDALTRTVSNSAEQISVAATSLHELSELSRQQLEQARAIPEKLTADLETLQSEQNEALSKENKDLQKELKALRASESGKLDELSERIQKAVEEIEKLKLAPPPVQPAPKKTRPSKPKPESKPAEPEPLLIEDNPEDIPEPVSKPSDPGTNTEPATESVEDEPTPSSEEPPPPPAADAPVDPVPDRPEEETPVPVDPELSLGESGSPKADHSISPDGVTRLLVSAYIGIGNRLFVRGSGAGLSEDKGVPLQFVSIGKWKWETSEADRELKVKLYKNDEIECTALGEITIDPGSQSEVSATF